MNYVLVTLNMSSAVDMYKITGTIVQIHLGKVAKRHHICMHKEYITPIKDEKSKPILMKIPSTDMRKLPRELETFGYVSSSSMNWSKV